MLTKPWITTITAEVLKVCYKKSQSTEQKCVSHKRGDNMFHWRYTLQSFVNCKYCLLSGRHYLFSKISIYVLRLGICMKNMLTCLMTKNAIMILIYIKSCAFEVIHIQAVTFTGKYKLTICVEHTFPQCCTIKCTCSYQWDPKDSNKVRDETPTSAMQSMYGLRSQWPWAKQTFSICFPETGKCSKNS